MLPRSSFVCVHAESFYFKAPPAACDNARKVDDKAHLHWELMYHDYVTLCGGRLRPPPAPPSPPFYFRATPRGLWQNASVWYGPPSVSSVCDQTCRQNSSACFAAMLWQNHKGGWYGPPTAKSSITLPLYAVTTPQRWMIRPTYIANECIMTMWRFAAPPPAPPSRLFILEPPPAPRGLWQHARVWYTIYLSICLFCLSVYLSIYPSINHVCLFNSGCTMNTTANNTEPSMPLVIMYASRGKHVQKRQEQNKIVQSQKTGEKQTKHPKNV